ncbi:chromate transporter [Polynucleobacter sp.]|uniref:chromate transporter n=1 Tax=Polynucleobacter sp. TaxID=2029855 RepID=UPI002732C71E|nr:chromate transporter [Polynucleobacter sp.]MDP3122349.1 chromate transporter [Polynucleobacter sp.]
MLNSSPTPSADLTKLSVSLVDLFLQFLIVGAVSFGGGIIAYERILLVEKRKWLNADQFMAYLAISQTMPGLNSVNLAVLTGDHLRGMKGSIIALIGLVLPGSTLVLLLGFVYTALTDHAITVLLLTGIAAGATGLLAAVTYRIGDAHWKKPISLLLIATTFILMSIVKLQLLEVLAIMLPIGLFIYRPKSKS